MRFVALQVLLAVVMAEQMLITKEYTEYLKKHVQWEVVEYEDNIFRGWTWEDADAYFTEPPSFAETLKESTGSPPFSTRSSVLPSEINWANVDCDHGVRNQDGCGSDGSFATAGMLSFRCCLQGHNHGWLSPQEVISCEKHQYGCQNQYVTWCLDYVKSVGGLVPESCFPYRAQKLPCPTKCVDGQNWASSHVCDCRTGYTVCSTLAEIKEALKSGPIALGHSIFRSFLSYKSGIYRCEPPDPWFDKLRQALAVGYFERPVCYFHMRNIWGVNWGMKGYYDLACDSCHIGKYVNSTAYCSQVAP